MRVSCLWLLIRKKKCVAHHDRNIWVTMCDIDMKINENFCCPMFQDLKTRNESNDYMFSFGKALGRILTNPNFAFASKRMNHNFFQTYIGCATFTIHFFLISVLFWIVLFSHDSYESLLSITLFLNVKWSMASQSKSPKT